MKVPQVVVGRPAGQGTTGTSIRTDMDWTDLAISLRSDVGSIDNTAHSTP